MYTSGGSEKDNVMGVTLIDLENYYSTIISWVKKASNTAALDTEAEGDVVVDSSTAGPGGIHGYSYVVTDESCV